ncbi:MAG TPA: Gfo/Idh/MocA family oxidoreductase [Actinomycetota bacterium]|nr:Gfo/Idh/MocA family oxidoreductase [Actinomycetota bacterium]
MKVGFIGCGEHATTSIYPALNPAGLELVATCARHQDRAEAAANKFGAEHAFNDARKMIETAHIEAVLISVHPGSYAPLIELCLEAKLPVFAEKPGAASSSEAAELAAKSKKAKAPVMVGYMKRFALAYREAKRIVDSPKFGKPSLGSFTFAMGPWGEGKKKGLRPYLVDNPVHHLDLARFFLGELSELNAHISYSKGTGYGIAVNAKASSGAVATFQLVTTASWFQRNESMEIFGAGHSVYVDNVDTCVYRPPSRPEQVWRPNYTVPLQMNFTGSTMGFVPELEHFRKVVKEKVKCESDIESAGLTLALAEKLIELTGA